MWPLGKKPEETTREPKADDWVLARGQRDGFPMLVRMAEAYIGLAPIPGYDHQVIISVHLRDPLPDGFPSSEEYNDLDALETSLSRILEIDGESLGVLTITNNGLFDLIFYTRNVEIVKQRAKDAAGLFAGFEIEFSMEPGEDWRIYQHFARWVARSSTSEAQH